MDVTKLNAEQREALLDLLILAMYADGHLDSIEDAGLETLLASMGFDTDYDRQKQLDAAVTRVRQHSQPAEVARNRALHLAGRFTTRELRSGVYELLERQICSDNDVAPEENRFLTVIREAFQLK